VTEPDHVSTVRAVYDASADAYVEAIGTEVTHAVEGPIDRALLVAFVEFVSGSGVGPVADVGCGPGRVAAFLAAQGIDVVGVDLSPAMLAVARSTHPEIRFDEGSLTALPYPDEGLAGAVCWYSIIHTPPEDLDAAFAELARVLARDGHLLVAFQAGAGECRRRTDAYGSGVTLPSYRHSADDVERRLTSAGLSVHARAVRAAELPHESSPQAFVFARRP